MLQMIRDWQMVRKQKEGLLAALKLTPPGACISIKNPKEPMMARAIIEILKENPNEIECVDFGFEVTLMRKVGLAKSMTAQSYESLKESYGILNAENITKLGLHKGHELPAHKFRDGVPDDINGKGEMLDVATKIIVEKP